jgi:entericidin B
MSKKWIALFALKILLLVIVTAAVVSMVGCNTMQGLGKDIEQAGEAIQRSTR